jgi:hypothetical protein
LVRSGVLELILSFQRRLESRNILMEDG